MFNNYDDWPSYMYFARKIIVTGGMLDPFNNRRVTSYGGGSVYQAIYVKLFGNQGIFAFDNFIGLRMGLDTGKVFRTDRRVTVICDHHDFIPSSIQARGMRLSFAGSSLSTMRQRML